MPDGHGLLPADRKRAPAAPFRLRCRRLDRSDQRARREGLVQAGDATGLHGLLMRALVVECGHEDDRHRRTGLREPPPQLDAGHTAKMNVEYQTICFAPVRARQERLRRTKNFGIETGRIQQAFKALQHSLVVVDHYDELSRRHEKAFNSTNLVLTAGWLVGFFDPPT